MPALWSRPLQVAHALEDGDPCTGVERELPGVHRAELSLFLAQQDVSDRRLEVSKGGHVGQPFFHGGVAELAPQRHKVDAQQRRHSKRLLTSSPTLGGVGLYQYCSGASSRLSDLTPVPIKPMERAMQDTAVRQWITNGSSCRARSARALPPRAPGACIGLSARPFERFATQERAGN